MPLSQLFANLVVGPHVRTEDRADFIWTPPAMEFHARATTHRERIGSGRADLIVIPRVTNILSMCMCKSSRCIYVGVID